MNSTETTRLPVSQNYQLLADNIKDALALVRKLEQVLGLAQEKMVEREIAGLESVLEVQVKLLNMLQLNGSLREHYLKEVGLPANKEGIHLFLSLCRNENELTMVSKHWQLLEEHSHRCKSLNQTNGRLLSRLAASTNRMIELMFIGQEPSTYNKQGICERKMG